MSAATSNVCKKCVRVAPLLAWFLAGCAAIGPDLPPAHMGGVTEDVRTEDGRTEDGRTEDGKKEDARAAPVRPLSFPPVILRANVPDDVLGLQVMLDRANFSPGCLDGRMGPLTRAALLAWQGREGLEATGEPDDALLARLPPAEGLFTTHIVSGAERAALRPFPADWPARAALDHHGYATILEGVAERYHTTERAMREWNPDVAWPNPPAGTALRAPLAAPVSRARAARIEIHLAGKYLQVFDAQRRLVAHFPCSIARDVEKRPVGELRIVNAAEDPNYTFDPALFSGDPAASAMSRRLLIPPGPNNPVGAVWLGLDRPGYGIHGTPAPEEIGKTESRGCFRLANWNARKLLGMVSIGLPVFVRE